MDNVKYGVFVARSKKIRYAVEIVDGRKPIETRNRNMLGKLVGERVAVIETQKNKSPRIVGYATITGSFFCEADRFNDFRNMTLIPIGDAYDNKGKGKWMYTMGKPIPCKPELLDKSKIIYHGRSYCEFRKEN